MRIKGGVIVLFLCLFSLTAFAQSDSLPPKRLFSIEAGYLYGKVLKIHPFFPKTTAAQGLEVQFMEQTAGRKYWHQVHGYYTYGASFVWLNLGNDSILGDVVGIYYFNCYSKKIFKGLKWDSRIGFGGGVFTKPYDPFENPTNFVIGSRATAFAAASTGLSYTFGKRFKVYAKASFLHFSNGHMRVPNIGANLLSSSFGLEYKLQADEGQRKKQELPPIKKRWLFNLDLGMGLHEVEGTVHPIGGPLYPVYFGSVYASKRLSCKGQFQVGFNLNYFTAYYNYIVTQQVFTEKERQKSYKALVFVGYEWIFGHIAFNPQLGINVYYPFRRALAETGDVNDRWMDMVNTNLLAFKYYTRPTKESTRFNPFIGLGLRTIGGKADFVEMRIGCGF